MIWALSSGERVANLRLPVRAKFKRELNKNVITFNETNFQLLTIFSQDFGGLSNTFGLGKEGADFIAGHDLPDGVVLHAIADDHVASIVQSPKSRLDFTFHASGADIAFCSEFNALQIRWHEVMDDSGIVLSWRTIIDTIDIGHQNGKISIDFDSNTSYIKN